MCTSSHSWDQVLVFLLIVRPSMDNEMKPLNGRKMKLYCNVTRRSIDRSIVTDSWSCENAFFYLEVFFCCCCYCCWLTTFSHRFLPLRMSHLHLIIVVFMYFVDAGGLKFFLEEFFIFSGENGRSNDWLMIQLYYYIHQHHGFTPDDAWREIVCK